MITLETIQKTIESNLPGSQVQVVDLTGTGDHIEVTVVSKDFEGKSPLERHRMIYNMFGADVGGAIHALSIKARTPDAKTP
ncbi:MAG: BolA family transcriptional regulator [Bdellovibrionales bacterium]|nr:BolA family transcriptional regulator [Bdellovibrionales bacterium]